MPRSLDPEFLRERPPAPRALGRLAALAGLVIAASIGAALALFVIGKFPSEFNNRLGLSVDKTAVESRFAGDTIKTPEQLSSPAARPRVHRRTRDPSARIQHAPRRFAMQVSAPRPSAG